MATAREHMKAFTALRDSSAKREQDMAGRVKDLKDEVLRMKKMVEKRERQLHAYKDKNTSVIENQERWQQDTSQALAQAGEELQASSLRIEYLENVMKAKVDSLTKEKHLAEEKKRNAVSKARKAIQAKKLIEERLEELSNKYASAMRRTDRHDDDKKEKHRMTKQFENELHIAQENMNKAVVGRLAAESVNKEQIMTIDKLRESIQQTESETNRLRAQQEATVTQTDQFRSHIERLEKTVEKLETEQKASVKAVKQFETELKQTELIRLKQVQDSKRESEENMARCNMLEDTNTELRNKFTAQQTTLNQVTETLKRLKELESAVAARNLTLEYLLSEESVGVAEAKETLAKEGQKANTKTVPDHHSAIPRLSSRTTCSRQAAVKSLAPSQAHAAKVRSKPWRVRLGARGGPSKDTPVKSKSMSQGGDEGGKHANAQLKNDVKKPKLVEPGVRSRISASAAKATVNVRSKATPATVAPSSGVVGVARSSTATKDNHTPPSERVEVSTNSTRKSSTDGDYIAPDSSTNKSKPNAVTGKHKAAKTAAKVKEPMAQSIVTSSTKSAITPTSDTEAHKIDPDAQPTKVPDKRQLLLAARLARFSIQKEDAALEPDETPAVAQNSLAQNEEDQVASRFTSKPTTTESIAEDVIAVETADLSGVATAAAASATTNKHDEHVQKNSSTASLLQAEEENERVQTKLMVPTTTTIPPKHPSMKLSKSQESLVSKQNKPSPPKKSKLRMPGGSMLSRRASENITKNNKTNNLSESRTRASVSTPSQIPRDRSRSMERAPASGTIGSRTSGPATTPSTTQRRRHISTTKENNSRPSKLDIGADESDLLENSIAFGGVGQRGAMAMFQTKLGLFNVVNAEEGGGTGEAKAIDDSKAVLDGDFDGLLYAKPKRSFAEDSMRSPMSEDERIELH